VARSAIIAGFCALTAGTNVLACRIRIRRTVAGKLNRATLVGLRIGLILIYFFWIISILL